MFTTASENGLKSWKNLAKQSEDIPMNKGYWALCEIESSLSHKVEELLREKNRLLAIRVEQLRHGYDVPSYTDGLDIRISTIHEILTMVKEQRNNLAEQEIENLKKQMENSGE
jgi:hypothetical protein